MEANKLLGITIPVESKNNILEKIKKYLYQPDSFFHIVSLNPENLVIAQNNQLFRKTIENAQIKIIDGIGIVLAAHILNFKVGERLPGVDLVEKLLEMANKRRLRVLLIGGGPNLAVTLANCYQQSYPEAKFLGTMGIKNIKNPTKIEEKKIFSIVADFKPHIVLVAFGSPDQELWIERHKNHFNNCLVMGVGGAFDFLSGKVRRAPLFIRKLGLEWLFRLLVQPWRWRRQLRLIEFGRLIFLFIISNIIDIIMDFLNIRNFFEVSRDLMIDVTAGWLGLITAPFILGDFKNYSLILTNGLSLFILGLLISLWLSQKSKEL